MCPRPWASPTSHMNRRADIPQYTLNTVRNTASLSGTGGPAALRPSLRNRLGNRPAQVREQFLEVVLLPRLGLVVVRPVLLVRRPLDGFRDRHGADFRHRPVRVLFA